MLEELGIALTYDHAGSAHAAALPHDQLGTSAGALYSRIVLLARDPRDTVVSGFHQASNRPSPGYTGDISAFVRDPRHGIEKTVRFNRLWQDYAAAAPVGHMIVVSYESLRADCADQCARILSFLNVNKNKDEILKVVMNNQFDKMQARERSGYYTMRYGNIFGSRSISNPNSYKVRRGKLGGYIDELSSEDIRYCNFIMKKYGFNTNN